MIWELLSGSVVKNLPAIQETAYNERNVGLIPGSGRAPQEGNGKPLQYSCLGNPMVRGAWQATIHGVARVGHDLATKPPPPPPENLKLNYIIIQQF